jgi:hypothetical protein
VGCAWTNGTRVWKKNRWNAVVGGLPSNVKGFISVATS